MNEFAINSLKEELRIAKRHTATVESILRNAEREVRNNTATIASLEHAIKLLEAK
jgi:predicted  nucleic acid-binding Zn-ribbon protein